MRELPYELSIHSVIVEDDNERRFLVNVLARSDEDARKRVAYILDHTSARIVVERER